MKKIILSILLIFSNKIMNAQSFINQYLSPKVNTVTTFFDLDSNCFDIFKLNNMDTLIIKDEYLKEANKLFYLAPNQTPYYHLFQNANIAMTSDNLIFDYFIFNDSGYYLLGSAGYKQQYSTYTKIKYEKPMLGIKFPIIINSSYNFETTKLTTLGNLFNLKQEIFAANKVNGLCKINILGQYYDVIKSIENIIFIDTYYLSNRNVTQMQFDSSIKYYSYNGLGNPLCSFNKSGTLNTSKPKTNLYANIAGNTETINENNLPLNFRVFKKNLSDTLTLQFNISDFKNETVVFIEENQLENFSKETYKTTKNILKKGIYKKRFNEVDIPISKFKNTNKNSILRIKIQNKTENIEIIYVLF